MKTLCRSNWFPFNGLLFLGVVCDYQRDIYWGFFVCRLIESSYALFSRRLRRSRRGMQQAIISQRKTNWVGCEIIAVIIVIVVLKFCLRLSARIIYISIYR